MNTKYVLFIVIGVLSPLFVTFLMSMVYGFVLNQYIDSEIGFILVGIIGSFICSMILYTSIGNLLSENIFITWLVFTSVYFIAANIGMLFAQEPTLNINMFFSSLNTWLFVLFGVFFVWIRKRKWNGGKG